MIIEDKDRDILPMSTTGNDRDRKETVSQIKRKTSLYSSKG